MFGLSKVDLVAHRGDGVRDVVMSSQQCRHQMRGRQEDSFIITVFIQNEQEGFVLFFVTQ